MRTLSTLSALIALVFVLAMPAVAGDPARIFINATEAYQQGDWPAAIQGFQKLVDQGIDNGQLYYNLGNAYLKRDDLGRALLWYERARLRIPDDPDMVFNYDYARTLTKDEAPPQEASLVRILFFWRYHLAPTTIAWLAIGLNAALWGSLGILAWRRKRLLRPTTLALAGAALLFAGTALFNYVAQARVQHAVILPEQVAVRSGFTDTATELFVLHAGTRVRVERQSESHMLVRYTADKIGWVKKSAAGII